MDDLDKARIKILEKYLGKEQIILCLLSKDPIVKNILRLIDNMNKTIIVSIKYGHYKRGLKYLLLLERICEKTFTNKFMVAIQEKVHKSSRKFGCMS